MEIEKVGDDGCLYQRAPYYKQTHAPSDTYRLCLLGLALPPEQERPVSVLLRSRHNQEARTGPGKGAKGRRTGCPGGRSR
jgi:hypothetical protein